MDKNEPSELRMRILKALTDCKDWLVLQYTIVSEALARICAWIPLLWKDRDYDWAFALDMLEFKLARMRKLLSECKHHSSHGKDIKQIDKALALLKRVRDDSIIHDEIFGEHEKKWGELEWNSKRGDDGWNTSCIRRKKVKTKADSDQEHKESRKLYKKLWRAEIKASKDFWMHIHKYYKNWWC